MRLWLLRPYVIVIVAIVDIIAIGTVDDAHPDARDIHHPKSKQQVL